MTPTQMAAVRRSFTALRPELESFAACFYDNLFTLAPRLERLFTGDRRTQERRLAAMLTTLVAALERIEALEATLTALGRRHRGYGVRPGDYDVFGDALLETLDEYMGDRLTRAEREAWGRFYALLAAAMRGQSDWRELAPWARAA